MSAIDEIKMEALAATRELMTAVEFCEQAADAIDCGDFDPATSTELESAESALIAVRSCMIGIEERIGVMKATAEL